MIVFVAGGTGYMGRVLIPRIAAQGHEVRALVRPGSERKLPPGCTPVTGNALESASFQERVPGAHTWVHLIGTPQPAPWKGSQFRAVDLASVRAAVEAAVAARIAHFVYVSVAQPAPVMKAYIEVRAECEALIRASSLRATILRPWYVLGPNHGWPAILKPLYWLFERLPSTRDSAQRLGLVTLEEMVAALLWAVNHPSDGIRLFDVSRIRRP